MDVWNLLTYDNNQVLAELLGPRSDNFKAKRNIIQQLQTTGKASLPKEDSTGTTQHLLKIMMISQGLHVAD